MGRCEISTPAAGTNRAYLPDDAALSARRGGFFMVWIVDDHEDTAELVAHVLTRHGIAATAFDNGASVLDALNHDQKPDLVILDMMMPVMDGIELLRRLRASSRSKDIPVVVYSADYTKGRMEEAMSLGASAYFVKGAVGFDKILKTVGKLTGNLN